MDLSEFYKTMFVGMVAAVFVLGVGGGLYFFGDRWAGQRGEQASCLAACGGAASMILSNGCHCQTATGWIKPEVAQ